MNRQYVQEIVDGLTKSVGMDKERVSIALAISLAYSLALPRESTDVPGEWYDQQYRWKVQQFVSEFNERYLLDVHLVIAGAKEIWLGRYGTLFIKDRQQILDVLTGQSCAFKFITEYEYSTADADILSQAAVLISDKVLPVINDMTNPSALVK